MAVEITFWGVRGSIPCASKEFQEIGGHTSCVSLHYGKDLLILDAGTGILDLGKWILQQKLQKATLFLTHFHYDHIIGFPFFHPIWQEGFHLDIYANNFETSDGLKNFFEERVFVHPFFPVTFDHLKATLSLHQFKTGDPLEIKDGIQIETKPLNHPGGSTGYRIKVGTTLISYITDTEHCPGKTDSNVMDLIKDSDLMIYDSMYTNQELETKKGWGHSTWEEAIRLAKLANAKQAALFHHDIHHTDAIMKEIEAQAQVIWKNVFVARQGMKIKID